MKTIIRRCFVLVVALALAPVAVAETEEIRDEQGRVERIVYEDGRVVDYRYDQDGDVLEQKPVPEVEPTREE